MTDNPRFQVREDHERFDYTRFVVVDTATGKRIVGKDSREPAEESARLLNDLWNSINEALR